MKTGDSYAPAAVWDTYFTDMVTAGGELNPEGWWVPGLLPFLVNARVQQLLDVGCGMGEDAVNLAQKGLTVTGMDSSAVALACARDKAAATGVAVDFRQDDMTLPVPFADEAFDAVMSNVALHMFDDQTTRRIIGEMRRVIQPGGLLLHINSTEDMSYRSQRLGRLRIRALEPDFYREANGQTMRFFSEAYCRDVLADWTMLDLTHLRLRDDGGKIFKCVWRCVAQRPSAPISAAEHGDVPL